MQGTILREPMSGFEPLSAIYEIAVLPLNYIGIIFKEREIPQTEIMGLQWINQTGDPSAPNPT